MDSVLDDSKCLEERGGKGCGSQIGLQKILSRLGGEQPRLIAFGMEGAGCLAWWSRSKGHSAGVE